MRKITFSKEAVADLREISSHSERAWGARRRDRYMAGLRAAMQPLRQQPEIGAVQAGCDRELRRIHSGRHFIFYEIQQQRIHIARILHDRMDIVAHLVR